MRCVWYHLNINFFLFLEFFYSVSGECNILVYQMEGLPDLQYPICEEVPKS